MTVTFRTVSGVMTITFNRPERRNAMTGPMLDGLADALAVANESNVAAVVLRGAGGAFSSGLDLDEFAAMPPPSWLDGFRESSMRAHYALFDCKAPVIGALERFAINASAATRLELGHPSHRGHRTPFVEVASLDPVKVQQRR